MWVWAGQSAQVYEYQTSILKKDLSSQLSPNSSQHGSFLGTSAGSEVNPSRLLSAARSSLPPIFITFAGLGAEYADRRNFFLDCVAERFTVVRAPKAHTARFAGSDEYLVYEKETPATSASRWLSEKSGFADPRPAKAHFFSFIPPSSGMFVWVSIFHSHN